MRYPCDLPPLLANITFPPVIEPNGREIAVRTHARLWLALAVLLAAAPIVSACNTVHGVGEDVSAVGRGVAYTADKIQGK
jgi:entericidin A